MVRGQRALVVLTTVVIGVGAVAGCDILPRSTHSDEEVLTDEVTEVLMDNNAGDITIRGDAATDQATVRRTLRYRGDLPEEATYRVEEGVLILEDCGRYCTAHYEVDVPADLPISGGTRNGTVDLSAVGEVDVNTDNGEVRIDGATGPVAVRTANGDIEITLAAPVGISVDAKNGDITLTVPDTGYQVNTDTKNGDVSIGITDDPGGEHRLELSTTNGDIEVRPA